MATDRRTLIADAAIGTIATEGMRGLTHRAVDRAAGLPEGSTSYYFRTRETLLLAALDRMNELDTADIAGLVAPDVMADLGALTEKFTALVRHWVTTARQRTLARYELSLEASRRPEARARMVEYGSEFRMRAERGLAAAGVPDASRRGRSLVDQMDGLMFHQIVGVGGAIGEENLDAACRDLLAAAFLGTHGTTSVAN